MPSNYAHYRFGKQLLSSLPADVRRPIQRFRRLYDMGLHGPDLFFYHNFLTKDIVASLGQKYHHQTGREYFTHACQRLLREPTEAGIAYLYGVLAHFCLDSVFHPFVLKHTESGAISHTELETEFDRFLLLKDGVAEPHIYDCSGHMKLTRGECVTVAEFYPPVTADNVLSSLRSMSRSVKAMAVPEGAKRRFVKKALSVTKPSIRHLMIPTHPVRACAALDEEMMMLYNEAAELYPQLVQQVMAHMAYNAYLGSSFDRTFDGTGEPVRHEWGTMEVKLS